MTVDEWAVTCTAPDSDGDVRFEAKACGEFHGSASAHLARLFWIAFDPSGSIPLLQGDNTLNQDIDDEDSVEIEASGYGKLGEGVEPGACQISGQVVLYPGEKQAPWTIPLPEAGQTGGKGPTWSSAMVEITGWRLTCSEHSDESASYSLFILVRNTAGRALAAVTFRVRVKNRKGDVWSTEHLAIERLAPGEMRSVETTLYVSECAKARKGAMVELVAIVSSLEIVIPLSPVQPVAQRPEPESDDTDEDEANDAESAAAEDSGDDTGGDAVTEEHDRVEEERMMVKKATAKESAEPDLLLEIDAVFVATCSSAKQRKAIAARVDDGRLGVSIIVQPGDDSGVMLMFSIYPDDADCSLSFRWKGPNDLECTLRGTMPIRAEKFMLDASAVRGLISPPALVKASISEDGSEDLAIKGGDNGCVVVGKVTSASCALSALETEPASVKAKSKKAAKSTLSKPVVTAIELILGGRRSMDAEISRVEDEGSESADYVLEAHVEALTKGLETSASQIAAFLDSLGSGMDRLGAALQSPWLNTPVVGWELRVRAAEALGAWSAAVGESMEAVTARLKSRKECERMWAARAVRAIRPKNEAALLKPLAKDPFQDNDGFYLVREAAGFHED